MEGIRDKMIVRDKRIGKSTYRIIKENDRFRIMEICQGKTAVTPSSYRTMEEAMQTVAGFDREHMIIGD